MTTVEPGTVSCYRPISISVTVLNSHLLEMFFHRKGISGNNNLFLGLPLGPLFLFICRLEEVIMLCLMNVIIYIHLADTMLVVVLHEW